MRLFSPDFAHTGHIGRRHTADGADLSPALHWAELPDRTQSLALIVDDPDAPAGPWTHWLLWDLPPSPAQLERAIVRAAYLPGGARQGRNDFGRIGWGGPDPLPGLPHRYRFVLYALAESPQLRGGADVEALRAHMRPGVLDRAELIGLYGREG